MVSLRDLRLHKPSPTICPLPSLIFLFTTEIMLPFMKQGVLSDPVDLCRRHHSSLLFLLSGDRWRLDRAEAVRAGFRLHPSDYQLHSHNQGLLLLFLPSLPNQAPSRPVRWPVWPARRCLRTARAVHPAHPGRPLRPHCLPPLLLLPHLPHLQYGHPRRLRRHCRLRDCRAVCWHASRWTTRPGCGLSRLRRWSAQRAGLRRVHTRGLRRRFVRAPPTSWTLCRVRRPCVRCAM
jgi:hypothetical protein